MLCRIVADLQENADVHPYYTLEDQRLYYKGRLVLAANWEWIPRLFQEFHPTPTGGHSGVYRTYRRMGQMLYWSGMKSSITAFVAPCHVDEHHNPVDPLLVKWSNGPAKQATWKEVQSARVPIFNLEDKVVSEEGGIVRALPNDSRRVKVYSRINKVLYKLVSRLVVVVLNK